MPLLAHIMMMMMEILTLAPYFLQPYYFESLAFTSTEHTHKVQQRQDLTENFMMKS